MKNIKEVSIKSSYDNSKQSLYYFIPEVKENERIPLLIALHPWSSNYKDFRVKLYLQECRKRNWALLHPDFRGPNNRPEACASPEAVQDVVDAVEYICRNQNIDKSKIYLVGVSGGGHMVLMMAAKHPELWTAVSAWAPISNLFQWYQETRAAGLKYYKDLEEICEGRPFVSSEINNEYYKRSPLFFLYEAGGLPIDINAGIKDGYEGSVPVSHSLKAFNTLAIANNQYQQRLTEKEIAAITYKQKVPENYLHFSEENVERKHKVLFQEYAHPTRVTIFKGGHEIDIKAALSWLKRW
ncbi:MAG: alpha/beta hydrolase family protein [Halanaerobiales bacterium]